MPLQDIVCHRALNSGISYINRGSLDVRSFRERPANCKSFVEVQRVRDILQEKYLRYFDTNVPFQWFAKTIGDLMSLGFLLYAIRPLHIDPQVKAPRMKEIDVLNLSTELLERQVAVLKNPATERWRWFVWVQWHALAVALAELCLRTEGPGVERAWNAVDDAFQLYGEIVADTQSGMLWQPIEKLMKKARQNRRTAQMANLSLGEQKQSLPNIPKQMFSQQPRPSPSVPKPAEVPARNMASPFGAMPNTVGNKLTPAWNVGILSPGSLQTSNSPMMQDNNAMDGLAGTPYYSTMTDSWMPCDVIAPSLGCTEDASAGFPLDMAWNNWEDFVGEVNLGDFDMSDPLGATPGSLQP